MLSNYCGYRKCKLILVFDAYKVKGYHGETEQYHNITVVYTKEAETADSYIEKATLDLSKKHKVRVATSDGMEPVSYTHLIRRKVRSAQTGKCLRDSGGGTGSAGDRAYRGEQRTDLCRGESALSAGSAHCA